MKCGSYEGDDEEGNMRITEIKNRCKDKRITYTDEQYAVVHCTGYIRVRVYYGDNIYYYGDKMNVFLSLEGIRLVLHHRISL